MAGALKPDPQALEILAQWRHSIGPEAFDASKPGVTLRARTSQLAAHPSSPDDTAVQTAAPKSAAVSTLAPKKDSLAHWSEYSIDALVNEGGMGQIFRADQGSLRRDVAIKKIIPEQLENESAHDKRESFVSEALVTGFLEHPNIVPVHSLGQDENGEWFFSMKMVRGVAWKYLLHPNAAPEPRSPESGLPELGIDDPARRAVHLEENLKILQAVCNAVAFAHSKNIIHRDLKPENVMVGAFGEVLVMDWGLAVDVSELPNPSEGRVPHKSMAGLGGTPSYLAPEQNYSDGTGLSERTDVFMLGAILHELLTGRAPNDAADNAEACFKSLLCEPPVFPENVPAELADICRKALSKNPLRRHPNALAIQQALSDFLKHQAAAAIAAKAETEAKVQEIPNLARAVVLYDQALELWPENKETRDAAVKARNVLSIKEGRARTVRWSLVAAVASIVLGLTVGFFWIKSAKDAETVAKKEAETQKGIAEKKAIDEADARRDAQAQKVIAEKKALDEAAARQEAQAQKIIADQKAKDEAAARKEAENHLGTVFFNRAMEKERDRDYTGMRLFAAAAIGYHPKSLSDSKSLLTPDSEDWIKARQLFYKPSNCFPIWESPIAFDSAHFSNGGRTIVGATQTSLLSIDLLTRSTKEIAKNIDLKATRSRIIITNATAEFAAILLEDENGLVKSYCVNLAQNKIIWQRSLHGFGTPTSVRWSPNQDQVAFSAEMEGIIIVDVKSGEAKTFPIGKKQCVCLDWHPTGNLLAVGAMDGSVALLDVATGTFKMLFEPFRDFGSTDDMVPNTLFDTRFSPSGRYLAFGGQDREVTLFDFQSNRVRWSRREHKGSVTCLSWTPDERLLASGCQDGVVLVRSINKGEIEFKLDNYGRQITYIDWTPDAKYVLTSGDGVARLWAAKISAKRAWLHRVSMIDADPRSERLLIRMKGAIGHLQMADMKIDPIELEKDVNSGAGAFLPEGKQAIVSLSNGKIWSLDFSKGSHKELGALDSPGDTEKFVSASNELLTYCAWLSKKGTLTASDGTRVWKFPLNAKISSLALAPNGTLAAGIESGEILVLNIRTGEIVKTLAASKQAIYAMAFSFDSTLLSYSDDDRVTVYRLKDGQKDSYELRRNQRAHRWGSGTNKFVVVGGRYGSDFSLFSAWPLRYIGDIANDSGSLEDPVWMDDDTEVWCNTAMDYEVVMLTAYLDPLWWTPMTQRMELNGYELTLKPAPGNDWMKFDNVVPQSHLGTLLNDTTPTEKLNLLMRYYLSIDALDAVRALTSPGELQNAALKKHLDEKLNERDLKLKGWEQKLRESYFEK